MSAPQDPAERRRTAYMMYDYLNQAPVFLPLAEPKPDGGALVEVPESDESLQRLMVSADAKSGTFALPMYLDAQSLQARFPGCRFVKTTAKRALELFLASKFDFLILNPEGRWVSWSREIAAETLEAGRLGPG